VPEKDAITTLKVGKEIEREKGKYGKMNGKRE
jgi:hypothetical protein